MCALSADSINARIRALFRRTSHRTLTGQEQAEYGQLVAAWTEADRQDRVSRKDVVEAA